MARGNELYARLEVSFMHRIDFMGLPVGARFLYLWLWCYALQQRHSTIPRPSNILLASMSGLCRHPIESYLDRLQILDLISYDRTYIKVHGIEQKHQKYQWSDSPYGDRMGHKRGITRARDTDTETETETETETKEKRKKKKEKRKTANLPPPSPEIPSVSGEGSEQEHREVAPRAEVEKRLKEILDGLDTADYSRESDTCPLDD
jgi:hypothetical protein